jgi:AraC family L-rhamnose operon transcriptional activator RhaR/AraC family L-rhamnose operon regulatory protein RhaS
MAFPALQRRNYFRDGRARVAVSREPHQFPVGQHRHEFLELVVILSGEGVHVTGQFQHRIQAGDVLVISRLRPHGYERTQGLNLLNILIREDALPRLARDLRHLPGFHSLFTLEALRWSQQSYASRLHLAPGDLTQISDWANRLEEETMRPNQGGYVLAEAYLILIMGLLVRCYGRPSQLATRPEAGMGRLLSWIETHLPEQLTIPLLARQAGMSVRSFHRHFHASTGHTPLEYVVRQRIARAKELLAVGPSARIDEIAAQCGFEDANYFSRVFRVRTRTTPREFCRKSLK